MAPALRSVGRIPNVRAADGNDKEDDLGEEPRPAAALLVRLLANLAAVLAGR